VTFNINSQTGGVINNVAGNQRISGGQEGSVVTMDAAREAARSLRNAIAAASLPPDIAASARTQVAEIDAEMGRETPHRPTVADRLRRLSGTLAGAGSLAAAATSIVGPIQTLVTWLGHLGEPIARIVPLLL
jgi:heme O synthase-like polyprenyltransferase